MTITEENLPQPKKSGRGRKNITVRFTPERFAEIKIAADASGKSLSEEIEDRVERLFQEDKFAAIRSGAEKTDREILGIAQDLLAKVMARNTELEKTQTLNEEMIERAVTKALTKMPAAASLGLTGQAPTVRIAISSSDAGVEIKKGVIV